MAQKPTRDASHFELSSLFDDDDTVQTLDIGSTSRSGVHIWQPLVERSLAHVTLFDHDPERGAQTAQPHGDRVTVRSELLFDGTPQTLFETSPPVGMTSLMRANPTARGYFSKMEQMGHVVHQMQVQTCRMDDLPDLPEPDFVTMNAKGVDINILRHGPRALRNCVAIELQLPFVPIFDRQPSLGEVDMWMRVNGFLPHCITDVKRWSIKPTLRNNDPQQAFNQVLSLQTVYVRDPMYLERYSDRQLKVMAMIAHYSLGSTDLVILLLHAMHARQITATNLVDDYIAGMAAAQAASNASTAKAAAKRASKPKAAKRG